MILGDKLNMKIILILGFFLQALVLAQPVSETDLENKGFDAKKSPAATETEIDRKAANDQWQALASENTAAKCAKADVWKADGPGQVTVVAKKNKTAAVKGTFDRVWLEITAGKKSGKVEVAEAEDRSDVL